MRVVANTSCLNMCMCGHVCRPDLTKEERDTMIDDLVREVTSLWQTDELRRQKPTPLDGELSCECE